MARASTIYDEIGTPLDKATVAIQRGVLILDISDEANGEAFDRARRYFEHARDVFAIESNSEGRAIALNNLGHLEFLRSNPEEASRLFDASEELVDADHTLHGTIALGRARVERLRGNPRRALERIAEALEGFARPPRPRPPEWRSPAPGQRENEAPVGGTFCASRDPPPTSRQGEAALRIL